MMKYVHPLKEESDNLMVTMVPLILFSDDVSGNRSKKWNGLDVWVMLLAGLSKDENAKLHNIHLITASNKVKTLELAEPIVKDLIKLERGVVMYDAYFQKKVVVVAPVLCIMADNPRSSELLNHGGSSARKFCRICQVKHCVPFVTLKTNHLFTQFFISLSQVDKQVNPQLLGRKRNKDQVLTQITIIQQQASEALKKEYRKKYGLRETYNPLFALNLDLYK